MQNDTIFKKKLILETLIIKDRPDFQKSQYFFLYQDYEIHNLNFLI